MRKVIRLFALAAAVLALAQCGGSRGSSAVQGSFKLIEFLESGLNHIPRNRVLTFRFSAPVAPNQDFPERLKIQNVQSGQGQSDFSRAIGTYVVVGDAVGFNPLERYMDKLYEV